jgi:hypothetical protein
LLLTVDHALEAGARCVCARARACVRVCPYCGPCLEGQGGRKAGVNQCKADGKQRSGRYEAEGRLTAVNRRCKTAVKRRCRRGCSLHLRQACLISALHLQLDFALHLLYTCFTPAAPAAPPPPGPGPPLDAGEWFDRHLTTCQPKQLASISQVSDHNTRDSPDADEWSNKWSNRYRRVVKHSTVIDKQNDPKCC